jgi:hypothetical protein
MNLRLIVVAAASILALAGCGTCTGFCSPTIIVMLVNEAGSAVAPATGTAVINGRTQTFDCAKPESAGICRTTSVAFESDVFTTFSLTVFDSAGKSYSGDIPTAVSDTSSEICGSRCKAGSTTVTLR